jgi:hypothetical protein
MPKGYQWVFVERPVKLDKQKKAELKTIIENQLEISQRLKDKVSRFEIKGGRVYFYELIEPSIPEECIVTRQLIEGRYLEIPIGRITLYDANGEKCSLDWQRYNNQWMELKRGSLNECINFMNEDDSWF